MGYNLGCWRHGSLRSGRALWPSRSRLAVAYALG